MMMKLKIFQFILAISLIEIVLGDLDKVPITKCCADEELYRIELDVCREWVGPERDFVLPSVHYIAQENETVSLTVHEAFQVTRNLSVCADGFVGKSSTEFKLYENGTAMVPTSQDFQYYHPGEFCIDQIPSENIDLAVRFCAPDPCHGAYCLRKCCPEDSVVNLTAKICQPSESISKFNVTFRSKENGEIIQPEESLILRDGGSLRCPYGISAHHPLENQEHEFYIMADGRMYVPMEERIIDEYCIDHFLEDDNALTLQALVCHGEDIPIPPSHSSTEITPYQLALSIFPYFFFGSTIFLMATFLVYALIPELQNIHGVTIMSYVASMTVAYIGLGNIQMYSANHSISVCKAIAVVTHFTFLAIFSWINVVSFDIWLNVRSMRPVQLKNKGSNRLGMTFALYSSYGWGVPFIVVVIGQIFDHIKQLPNYLIRPNFGLRSCWFGTRKSLLVYLYGPVGVFIFSNIVFFTMTAVYLYKTSLDTAMVAGNRNAKQRLRVIFSLFLLMGIPWMTEIISYIVGGDAYNWFFTDIINILTGVYVFVIFVCKPKVWKLLKIKFPSLERLDVAYRRFYLRCFYSEGDPRPITPAVSRTASADSNTSYIKRSVSGEISLSSNFLLA